MLRAVDALALCVTLLVLFSSVPYTIGAPFIFLSSLSLSIVSQFPHLKV